MGFERTTSTAVGQPGGTAAVAFVGAFGDGPAETRDRLQVFRGLLVMLRLAWLDGAARSGGPNSRRDDHL